MIFLRRTDQSKNNLSLINDKCFFMMCDSTFFPVRAIEPFEDLPKPRRRRKRRQKRRVKPIPAVKRNLEDEKGVWPFIQRGLLFTKKKISFILRGRPRVFMGRPPPPKFPPDPIKSLTSSYSSDSEEQPHKSHYKMWQTTYLDRCQSLQTFSGLTSKGRAPVKHHSAPSSGRQMMHKRPIKAQSAPASSKLMMHKGLTKPQPNTSSSGPMVHKGSTKPQPNTSSSGPMVHKGSTKPQPAPSCCRPKKHKGPAEPLEAQPDYISLATPKPFSMFLELYEAGHTIVFGKVGTYIHKYDGQKVVVKFVGMMPSDRYILIPGYCQPLPAEVALYVLLSKPPTSQYIISMKEWFKADNHAYLMLEYPHRSFNLKKFIRGCGGRVSEDIAQHIMRQVVMAVKDCLDRGVSHQDIKSQNILINKETLEVKLTDFSHGEIVDSSDFDITKYSGKALPVDYRKRRRYESEISSVWSLGCMLYYMLMRRDPFFNRKGFVSKELFFHSMLSEECQVFICMCLIRSPVHRATLQQLLDHEWFKVTFPLCVPKLKLPKPRVKKHTKEPRRMFYACYVLREKNFIRNHLRKKKLEKYPEKILKCFRRTTGKEFCLILQRRGKHDLRIFIPGNFHGYKPEVAAHIIMRKHLKSQHVLTLHEVFACKMGHILVFESPHSYLTLKQFILRYRRLSEEQARDLIVQAALGAIDCLDQGINPQKMNVNNMLVYTETQELKLTYIRYMQLIHVSSMFNTSQYSEKDVFENFSTHWKFRADVSTVWSLGGLLHRMVNGLLPCRNWLTENLLFHPKVSKECRDLIKRCRIRSLRRRPTIQQFLEHEWFKVDP